MSDTMHTERTCAVVGCSDEAPYRIDGVLLDGIEHQLYTCGEHDRV